jgi:hypothetical protein
MIIHDFNVFGAVRRPAKHDAPLIVDPNRVSALSIPLQSLKPISRRDCQVPEVGGVVQLDQLPTGDADEVRGKTSRLKAVLKDRLGPSAAKAPDHKALRITS